MDFTYFSNYDILRIYDLDIGFTMARPQYHVNDTLHRKVQPSVLVGII